MHELTSGSCVRIHNATSDDPVFDDNHVLQILSIKPISIPTPNAVPRFRIILSDGVHYVQAMLANQLNRYVQDQQIQKHSVIQVSKMSCNILQNKQ
jgi:replication factor A1